MNKKILTFAGIVLWMSLLASVAQAQSRQAFVVTIPFAFVMGDQTMSPGEYEVEVKPGSVLEGHNFNIIALRSRRGHDYKAIATGVAQPLASMKHPQLGFRRYGDRAFLSELTTPTLQIGIPLSKGQVQREISRQQHEEEIVTLFVR